jgi:hypothetical protein
MINFSASSILGPARLAASRSDGLTPRKTGWLWRCGLMGAFAEAAQEGWDRRVAARIA